MLQCTSGVSPFPLFFFFFVSCSSTLLSLFFFFRLGEHSLLVLLSPACCMRFSCQSPYTFLFLLFFFFNKSSAKTGKKKHTHTHICKYIYIQTIDFFLLSLMSKSIHVKRTGSLCAIALGDSAWHFLLQACQRREKKKKDRRALLASLLPLSLKKMRRCTRRMSLSLSSCYSHNKHVFFFFFLFFFFTCAMDNYNNSSSTYSNQHQHFPPLPSKKKRCFLAFILKALSGLHPTLDSLAFSFSL